MSHVRVAVARDTRSVAAPDLRAPMQNQPNQTILAVVSDLFFSAKINEAAKHAGVKLEYVTAEKDLLQKARSKPALIIFDLNFDAAQPLKLIGKLKADAELKPITLLGY